MTGGSSLRRIVDGILGACFAMTIAAMAALEIVSFTMIGIGGITGSVNIVEGLRTFLKYFGILGCAAAIEYLLMYFVG